MIEFDLKECISFGLGVIKRFLVLDSVFVLPEEFDNFFFVSPTEVLRCLWDFLNRGWVYLVLDVLRTIVQSQGTVLFALFVFILYFDGFHEFYFHSHNFKHLKYIICKTTTSRFRVIPIKRLTTMLPF